MKCLLLLIGESFRLGGQNNRNRGSDQSKRQQMNACKSHTEFIKYLKSSYNIDTSISISSYTTKFDKILTDFYNKYLIYSEFNNEMKGLNKLFHNAYGNINKNDFDFILYIRIDLQLKNYFFEIFNPFWETIYFPSVTWILWSEYKGHPRVNDMMLFIHKKYYNYIDKIEICHESWYNLMITTDLTYQDLNIMLDTYHDSDSEKDYNPIYRIVNRGESKTWYSRGYVFEKNIIEKFEDIDYKKNSDKKKSLIFIITILIMILFYQQ